MKISRRKAIKKSLRTRTGFFFFTCHIQHIAHTPMQVPDRWWNKFENKKLEMLHSEPEKEDVQFTRTALAMCENK